MAYKGPFNTDTLGLHDSKYKGQLLAIRDSGFSV